MSDQDLILSLDEVPGLDILGIPAHVRLNADDRWLPAMKFRADEAGRPHPSWVVAGGDSAGTLLVRSTEVDRVNIDVRDGATRDRLVRWLASMHKIRESEGTPHFHTKHWGGTPGFMIRRRDNVGVVFAPRLSPLAIEEVVPGLSIIDIEDASTLPDGCSRTLAQGLAIIVQHQGAARER